MQQQSRMEDNRQIEASDRRDESDRDENAQLGRPDGGGTDLSDRGWIQEIESDPAVAGADSPCQHLLGG